MLVARGVTVTVAGKSLLHGVDLSLAPGRVVGVVGPNGAGKSTLLKAMTGERAMAAGEVELDGRPLKQWAIGDLARRRAVLAQSTEVVFPFLVSEIVSLAMRPNLTAAEQHQFAQRALAAVDMSSMADRIYGTLSGGEKQRVQLARVLAQVWTRGCTYLMLDEPTNSLDLSHQLLILRVAREHAENGGGVLMILHDLNLASMAADEIVALKDGHRIAAGAPKDIMTDHLIAALYGVEARVRGVPDGPFLLPQTAKLPN
jgi:iron complex transport system ATP-binding protein